jgi:hypothetical protein
MQGGRNTRTKARGLPYAPALLVGLAALLRASTASAFPGLESGGGQGFMLLPSAQSLPAGDVGIVTQLGFTQGRGDRQLGLGPLGVGAGLPTNLELSFGLRENGLPRDLVTAGATTRVRMKLTIIESTDSSPAVGVEGWADHLFMGTTPGGRVLVTSRFTGGVMTGIGVGYHGGWAGHVGPGPNLGAAVAVMAGTDLELVGEVSAEGLSPWGVLAAAGARWRVTPVATLALMVASDVTGRAGTRVALGLNLRSRPEESYVPPPTPVQPQRSRFTSDRPHFKMKVPERKVGEPGYEPLAPEPEGVAAPGGGS